MRIINNSTMEEIGATNSKYQSLQVTYMASFVRPPSKNHPLGTHSIIYYTNIKYFHCVRNSWSEDPSNPFLWFCVAPIQITSFHQNNYYTGIRTLQFFLSLFCFHCTHFLGTCVTGNYYLSY